MCCEPFIPMKPIFIIAIIPSGTPTPQLDCEIRNQQRGEWCSEICFSLKYSPDVTLANIKRDLVLGKNIYIRTDVDGGIHLSTVININQWNALEVVILPDSIGVLYNGKITPRHQIQYCMERQYLALMNSSLKRIIFLDAKSCAEQLIHEWNVVNESLVC